jgi:hypothetical protein
MLIHNPFSRVLVIMSVISCYIYLCEYTPIYIRIIVWGGWTSIGVLSEVWVGGSRDTGSDSDLGRHLRTTGPGPHTTLDLTHVRNSLGQMDY